MLLLVLLVLLLLLLLLFVLLLLSPTKFVNGQLRCKQHAKSVQRLPGCWLLHFAGHAWTRVVFDHRL
jgi:hypothetical protein